MNCRSVFSAPDRFKITQWADGENAAAEPTDLEKSVYTVNPSGALKIDLAKNGGFAARILMVSE